MKNHNEFPHAYYWELLFDNGRIISQLEQYSLPKENSIDLNLMNDFSFGIPTQLKLIDVKSKDTIIKVDIPNGCFPVYFIPTLRYASGFTARLGFSIGWRDQTHRTIFNVDPVTGSQTLLRDKV